MSELIQPVLVFRGYEGEVAVVPLQIDTSRVQAETEAAFLMETDPLLAQFAVQAHTVTVLMLEAAGVDTAVDALFAGLAVHSLDCDCQAHVEPAPVEWHGFGMQCHPHHSEDCGV